MPKYLFQATYTAEGIKGLEKDKAAGRKAALSKAVESLGGKLEALYWAFGEHDWVLIADLPDNASATAFSFALSPVKAWRRPDVRANGGASVTRYGQIFFRLRDAFCRRPSKTRSAFRRCFLL
jgi:uncharacterized protein with GYD domain